MSAVALVTFVDAELIGTLRLVVAGATTHNRLLWLTVSHTRPVEAGCPLPHNGLHVVLQPLSPAAEVCNIT